MSEEQAEQDVNIRVNEIDAHLPNGDIARFTCHTSRNYSVLIGHDAATINDWVQSYKKDGHFRQIVSELESDVVRSTPLLAGTIAPTRSPSPATSDGSEPDSCAPYLHGLQIDSAYLRSTTDPVWSSVYWYIDRNGSTVYTDCAEQPCPHAKETQDSIPGFYLSGLRGELVLPLVPQYLHPTSPPSRVPPPSSPPPPYSPKLPDYPILGEDPM
ncbi:hypothetical protein D9611_006122 [Ephemerocybe angulata]|uniref:Uncharacterized protein n=1 Tax=Ephemerocybe angulata TaxID=980116 RepID=A0A8H5CG91_9AGAR|nr:hypothetical protein D9611_006122 [Tulosesus angulatus]